MKRKSIISAVLIFAAACFFTACGGNAPAPSDNASASQSKAAPAAETKKVTMLLDWTPNTNHTGLYVAKELGYYADEGLEVNIEIPYEATSAQLLGAGKGEFGVSNSDDILHAVTLEDPMPVKSIAAVNQHNTSGFVSLAGKGPASPAEWGGRTYGGYGGAIEESIVRSIAQESKVDPGSIKFITLGNSDILTALNTDVDFAWVFEGAELMDLKIKNVDYNYVPLKDCNEEFDYYTPVIAVNTDAAAKDPEMVKAFMRATAKGYEYAADNPEEAAKILINAEPGLNEELIMASQEFLSEQYRADAPKWGVQDEEVWKEYADYLFQNGLIEKEADLGAAFTNEYLPEN